jgi:REP element-mobilizing transposase RayT
MSRPWRENFEGAVYHVTARGNNRQKIFHDASDHRDFLALLARASTNFRLEIMAFCLMPNHYHLFLRTPEPNLSQAMHFINSSCAVRARRRHHLIGHLFQGRFRAVVVCEPGHWNHLSMYIHLNPVRAGLVRRPEDYEWSSFRDYLAPQPRYPWLHREPVLALCGGDGAGARRLYREQCRLLAREGRWEDFQRAVTQSAREMKSKALERTTRPQRQPAAGTKRTLPVRIEIDLQSEIKRLARAAGSAPEAMVRHHHGLPFRPMLYYHLVHHRGLSMTRTARLMGVSLHAVSKGIQRLQPVAATDPRVASILKQMSMSSA